MRTSPRQSPGHPGYPPEASFPHPSGPHGGQRHAGPAPTGAPPGQPPPGYGAPEVDEHAYARALYGDGGVHAGPGTGLGYADGGWAGTPYGGSHHGDPDTTARDLAGRAYRRALYGDPGRSAPPLEDPALGHPDPWYAAAGYGDDLPTMPAAGPDST